MSCSSVLIHPARKRTILYTCRFCRYASGSSNPYPYPTHSNPQPQEIFHLPRSATQKEIKQRYYDLVRIYHPDSPVARKYPPEVSQARFQTISKAYDIMRGKSAITGEVLAGRGRPLDPARFRPKPARRPHLDQAAGNERWKESILFGATALAIGGFVVQTTFTRKEAIDQARSRGRAISSASSQYSLADEALAESTEPPGSKLR